LRTAGQEKIENIGRAAPTHSASWANQELWAPCFKVNVVGTTGSGDATIAGFLSAFLREYQPKKALTAAVAVGACNVEAYDALSGLLSWDATMQRVANNWSRHSMNLSKYDWKHDPEDDLWKAG
jgi:sugar/nucleoside kinase (ribokinase family)